jgi:folylpolyglutamate synthase/dihydropteroate synthase
VALGFERIRALVEKLANPQEELKTLQEIFRNRGKVVRLLIQKDADVLVLTRPKGERAADPSWVSEEICPLDGGGNTATVRVDVHDAYVAEMGGRARAVLVTGSLQTAAGLVRLTRGSILGWKRSSRRHRVAVNTSSRRVSDPLM